jgi:RNA polymerase sigma-70 factor (ECF subfamily)
MRDDNALLQRLQAGDEHAIGELVDTYGQRIYQLAFRYLRNREDAEEATQDVLFKVYRKVGAFRGDAALSSWIYRITFNTAMSRLRITRTMRLRELADVPVGPPMDDLAGAPRPHDPADWSNLADEQVLRLEMREQLVRARCRPSIAPP